MSEQEVTSEVGLMPLPVLDSSKVSFYHEALTAAINEACAGEEEAKGCNLTHPCIFCRALAKQIETRLIRAFIAGQKSMAPAGD